MASDSPASSLTPEQHLQLGIELFNFAWTLLDKSARMPNEIEEAEEREFLLSDLATI